MTEMPGRLVRTHKIDRHARILAGSEILATVTRFDF